MACSDAVPNAVISIEMHDAKDYIAIISKDIRYKRSKVLFKESGDGLKIRVEADDAKSLISTMGSVMKQLLVISDVARMIEKKKGINSLKT